MLLEYNHHGHNAKYTNTDTDGMKVIHDGNKYFFIEFEMNMGEANWKWNNYIQGRQG